MKSDAVRKGMQQAPHRSLFNALGMTEEEMNKPLVGIVSSYNEIVPGHMNLDKIVNAVKLGVAMAGGTPVVFPAIAVCDGIAMGHVGMKYSLVTRDLIADSTECMAIAHQFDALVSFAFNLGQGNLRKLCARRTASQIATSMLQYCKANGKVLACLRRRRVAEQALFNKTVAVSPSTSTSKAESEDYNMKVIKKGSKGNAVKVWQIIVGANPDGRFGSGTESKTIAWQKNHGLAPDGIVGKNSWKAGLESL